MAGEGDKLFKGLLLSAGQFVSLSRRSISQPPRGDKNRRKREPAPPAEDIKMFQVIKKNCRRLAVYYNFWLIDRTRGQGCMGFSPTPQSTGNSITYYCRRRCVVEEVHTHTNTVRREIGGPALTKVNYTTKAPSVCFLNPNHAEGAQPSRSYSQLL